jgi:tetratricopeptide (TPR) repeat protein
VPEIGTAQAAIRGAQPDALDAADRALQARIAGGLTGDALARAQLAQAEVVASLAIWQRLMAAVDPAQSDAARFDADDLAVRAAKILASVDARAIEAPALVKARARVQLAEGSTPAPVAGDAELALLVQASALWQDPDGPVPTGLVAGLMQLAEPSALARCVLAIAHVRSGDEPGARAIVDSLTLGASPPPVAVALARVLREPETPTPVGDTEGGGDTDPDAPPTGPDTSAVAVGPGALVDPDAGTEPAHDSGGNSGGNSGGDSGADTGAGTTKPPKDPGRDSGGDGGDSPQTMSVSKMIDVGCSKAETGKGAEALDLLEKAKERRPGDLDISICMGLAYLDLGRNSQALSAFDHVLERSPKMGAALRGAAKAARKSGKTKQAVEYYKRVLEMEPRNAEARAFVDAQEGKGGNDAGDDDKPTSPTPFDTGTSESKSGDGE